MNNDVSYILLCKTHAVLAQELESSFFQRYC